MFKLTNVNCVIRVEHILNMKIIGNVLLSDILHDGSDEEGE